MATAGRPMITKLPKNTVVSYKGGGYSGCFWEWNLAYIDNDGNFHDVYSSGYLGIHNANDLLTRMQQDDKDWAAYYERLEYDRAEADRTGGIVVVPPMKEWYNAYNMGDENERNEMADSESIPHVRRLVTFFKNHPEFGVEITVKCGRCEERISPEGCVPVGCRSCGGFVFDATDLICPTCHVHYTCWYCEEYTEGELCGTVEIDGETVELRGRACETCVEDFEDGRRDREEI